MRRALCVGWWPGIGAGVVLLTLCLASCGGRASHGTLPPVVAPAGDAVARPFVSVSLERRPCFGRCPVYVVSVTGDGAVSFDGRAHVDSAGRHTARIDSSRVAAIGRLVDELQFFALDDRYVFGVAGCGLYAADASVTVIAVTTTTRTKTVEHDAGCSEAPPDLAKLGRSIDEIVGTVRWIDSRRPPVPR